MKFQKISTLLIWSEHYKELADWYQKTFDLKIEDQLNHPKDTGISFDFPDGTTRLWIGQHSEIHGKSKDPKRIMFNITVDSVEKAYTYLVKKGVKILAKPFKAPTFNKYFITFYDLDGNVVQCIGDK
jgi:predicted enzyme related to lactoylglutathione lyase